MIEEIGVWQKFTYERDRLLHGMMLSCIQFFYLVESKNKILNILENTWMKIMKVVVRVFSNSHVFHACPIA